MGGRLARICCGALLAASLAGCETLEKKFVRKRKGPRARATPVISFQDYSKAMTPVDRYRKHYMIFDYWNTELVDALQAQPVNPKRYKRASTDALNELVTMQALLDGESAERLGVLIEERAKLDRQLQAELVSGTRMSVTVRALEIQAREINRNFFWRDVEDTLKPPAAAPAPAQAAAQAAPEAAAPADAGTP